MPSENVTTKFRVDISDLKKNIAEANRQVKLYQAELKNASAGMAKGEETADSLSRKVEAQSKIVEAEQSKLQSMRDELTRYENRLSDGAAIVENLSQKHREAADAYGENSEEAKKLAKQLSDAQAAQERNANAANDLRLRIVNQDTAVKNAAAQTEKYRQSLSEMQNAEVRSAEAAKEQEKADQSLTSTVKAQETELKKLKQQYMDTAAAQGKDSDAAKELAGQITALSTDLKDNRQKLDEAGQSADSFDKSLDDTGKAIRETDDDLEKTTKGGLSSFTVALGNLAANVITAVVSQLGELAEAALGAFEDFDAGRDALIKATGAAGDAADEMTEAYSKVAKSVSGDMETIGAAVGEVNTRFGFTGDKLSEVSEDFMRFAEITGMDAVSAVQGVSRALESAGMDMEQYPQLLDKIAAASQASGISADKLTDSLTTYGAQMRAIGYDTDDTIAMLAQFEKAGVNTETALTGLRKANAEWAKDGKDARQELAALIEEIQNTPDSTEAAGKAVGAFGTKAGAELADAIRSGRFEFDAFTETVAASGGTVEKTYEETQSGIDRIRLAAQGLSVTFGEAAGKIVDEFAPGIENIISLFTDILSGDEGAADSLGSAISDLISKAVDYIVQALPTVFRIGNTLITTLTESLLQSAPQVLETLLQIAVQSVQGLAEFLPRLATMIADMLPDMIDALFDALPQIIDGIVQLVTKLAAALPGILKKLVSLIPKLIREIVDLLLAQTPVLVKAVIDVFNALMEALPDIVLALAETLPDILDALTDLIAGSAPVIIDAVIQVAMALLKAMPKIAEALYPAIPIILEALTTALIEMFPKMMDMIGRVIVMICDDLPQLLGQIWDSISGIFAAWGDSLMDGLAQWLAGIWLYIEGVYQEAVSNTEAALEAVVDFITGVFEEAVQNVEDVFSAVGDFFTGIWNGFKDGAASAWDFITGTFDEAVRSVTEIFSSIADFFTGIWDGLKDGAVRAWDGIKNAFKNVGKFFTDIWDKIREKFATIGTKIAESIGSAFKTAINAVLTMLENNLNFVPRAINKAIDLINNLPGVEISPLPEIRLPRLAKGGIVDKATVAEIGENGREAIIPLERNTQGLKQIAQMLAQEIRAVEMQTNAPQTNVTNAGTTIHFTQNNSSPKALSDYEIWRQTKNAEQLMMSALKGV